ncbi:MAG: hypothetical protein HY071_03925 [Chloroflexi bacterium]|nr:hypothetical protein [Chloroflexota bacterium]
MRRIVTSIMALALGLSLVVGLAPAPAAAVAGFDSAYQFESAFLSLAPGDTGTFSVFFANTGTTAWVKGTANQVNLATCLSDKLTCNVPPENAAFASAWLSSVAYAAHTKDTVTPGDFSAFTYTVKVPTGQAAGTYRFNGDLVQASTLQKIHPEGYYQDVTVAVAAATFTATPAFAAANDKMNFVSTTIPGNGQHTVTFTASALVGQNLSFVVIDSANVVNNTDGTYSFCDTNSDSKADILTDGTVSFTAVNGVSITQAATVINQPVPSSGIITVTIDSSTRNRRVRVIAWQDKSANGQVELTGAGDTNCNAYTPYNVSTDGLIAVSGRKFFTGSNGTFGAQFPDTAGAATCNPVYRFSATLGMLTAGPTSDTSLRYVFDSNDTFRISGTPVSLTQFFNAINANASGTGDKVTVNYNPDPAGVSEINICSRSGFAAPSNVTAAVGNFDAGATAEDVRLSFTTSASNTITTYPVQRAPISTTATSSNCALGATAPSSGVSSAVPADTNFVTVGSVTANSGQTASFTNFDLANGGYCFRVRTTDPTTGAFSYSNYVPVNVPGVGDTTAPTSTSAVLSTSAGFGNTLDTGDKIAFNFSEAISLASNATIRFTDSDCGNATNAGPAACTGGTTNTVGDVICGTNATCTLNTANTELTVTMTANPTIAAAGSTAGLQYPIVVTDASGITDTSGNLWNFASSADRLITNP